MVEKVFGRFFFCIIISSEIVWMNKHFWENFFRCKSFPRKQSGWKKIQNFFLLQNHFLQTVNEKKKKNWENFCCCKIIYSETVWMKKLFWESFLLLNHFFGNSLDGKKIELTTLRKNIICIFSIRNKLITATFTSNINRTGYKKFQRTPRRMEPGGKKILWENLFLCKIICSEIAWMNKNFCCCKIISSETVWKEKHFWEIFYLRNDILGNSLEEKKFLKKFW